MNSLTTNGHSEETCDTCPRSHTDNLAATPQLSKDAVREIEARQSFVDFPRHVRTPRVLLTVVERDALIRDWIAMRAERLEIQRLLASSALEDPTEDDDPPYSTAELIQGVRFLMQMKAAARQRVAALREQLAKAQTRAHELALIVDVGTNDDPGTALSKLHKIQHVAATAMRDKCVEKVKAMAAQDRHFGAEYNLIRALGYDLVVTELEKLTLDQIQEKQS